MSGSISPDLTAYRAVDACGGTYSAEQEASGYAQGHRDALDAALESVKAADSRANLLLDAAHALVGRDCKYIGAHIVIPCADHAEAIGLVNRLRTAIALTEGR